MSDPYLTPEKTREICEAIHKTTMNAINPLGIWAPIMIVVTWAIAIPFFIFLALH